MKSVAFETLGCKLNFSETSSVRRGFMDSGYQIVEFDDNADIYVINTCSVTRDANSGCRKKVRQALRRNPHAFVAVIGCYAQLEPEEIAEIEGVDLVLGAKEKFHLLEIFENSTGNEETLIHRSDVNEAVDFHHAFSSDDRTRAFLKVQDGCSYKCSFCTIPLARGRSRSPGIATVVQNARQLVREGYKEIVVTGVNAGDFGAGTDENFYLLLQALEQVKGLKRIRISSVEPNLLHKDIIRLAASSELIQPHFHIPLQSGSDTMLKMMRRRYNTRLYRERIELIREVTPEACIGVDVIAGHPGETRQLFEESFDFIDSLDISYLHVFTYSERPETQALDLEPVIPVPERKNRTRRLRRLSAKKRYHFNSRFIGSERPVLLEGSAKGKLIRGWTDNYIRVDLPFRSELENSILPVRLEKHSGESVTGRIDQEYLEQQSVIAAVTG